MHEPIGYFLTWTVYGSYLQGDSRWWRSKQFGHTPPMPLLLNWHKKRLRHKVLLLGIAHRQAVEEEIQRLCTYRGWNLSAVNARSNHAHVVVSAESHPGNQIRDQLKANCTRVLRQRFPLFRDRPVWTSGGDWRTIFSEADLDYAIEYVREAQDRMGEKE